MTIVAVAFAPPPLPRWRGAAIRDLLHYGGPAAFACFAWAGFRNGDYAIVGARLGAAQAGFYWRGFQLAVEYQGKVSAVMTQMAFPVLARTADADAMFALRRRMVRLLTVVVFPALVLLVLLAPGGRPLVVRRGVGAGRAADADPRRRRRRDRRHRRRWHRAHGCRSSACTARLRRRALRRLRGRGARRLVLRSRRRRGRGGRGPLDSSSSSPTRCCCAAGPTGRCASFGTTSQPPSSHASRSPRRRCR